MCKYISACQQFWSKGIPQSQGETQGTQTYSLWEGMILMMIFFFIKCYAYVLTVMFIHSWRQLHSWKALYKWSVFLLMLPVGPRPLVKWSPRLPALAQRSHMIWQGAFLLPTEKTFRNDGQRSTRSTRLGMHGHQTQEQRLEQSGEERQWCINGSILSTNQFLKE